MGTAARRDFANGAAERSVDFICTSRRTKMKTKWMCMILMLALTLNLSACGNRQENGNSSENGNVNIEPQSVEDDSSENTGNESSEMNVIDLQDNGTDKKIMAVSTVKDSTFSGKVRGCYYAGGSRIIIAADIKKRAGKPRRFWSIKMDLRSSISSISISARMRGIAVFSRQTDGWGFLAKVRLISFSSLAFC